MTKGLQFYAMYTFSTSPHSFHRTTLLNTKVLQFTVSRKNCETFILSELRQLSINLIAFGIDDKIAEIIFFVIGALNVPAHKDISSETMPPLIDSCSSHMQSAGQSVPNCPCTRRSDAF